MLCTTATSAATLNASCEAQPSSRDVEAEEVALSLARRRGQGAPSVDTKLANAWLGFYVALTKSSSRPTGAATQASTEFATETSLSEVASSPAVTPRTSYRDAEDDIHLTALKLQGSDAPKSWADVSDSEPEASPTKRSKRPHRRRNGRRTRGKGKKKGGDDDAEELDEESIHVDKDVDGHTSSLPAPKKTGFINATKPVEIDTCPQWPFQATPVKHTCPSAILPAQAFQTPTHCDASARTGLLISTSPTMFHTPTHCDASARTPLARSLPFVGSPGVCPVPSATPTFGILSHQGSSAIMSPMCHQAMSVGFEGYCMGSPYQDVTPACHGQLLHSPSSFLGSPIQPPPWAAASAPYEDFAVKNQAMDAMRSWLGGGLPTNDADLATCLQAAAPDAYED